MIALSEKNNEIRNEERRYSASKQGIKMKKALVAISMLVVSNFALAAVDCIGIPSEVKVGEYSGQEQYLIVRINGLDYRLGKATDDYAKARLSVVQTALVAEKRIKIKFYSHSSCNSASSARATPNAVQLLRT